MRALIKSGVKQKRNEAHAAGKKTLKRFSIVQKTFLLALVVQICAAGSLKAQVPPTIWNNFGSGTDGALTVSSTVKVDDTKAVATGITSVGAAPYTIYSISVSLGTLGTDYTKPIGTPINNMFVAGDRVILIDMGTPSGQNYDYGTVITSGWSVSGATGTLQIQAPYISASVNYTWHLGFLNNAQVIKIHQYSTINMQDGGVITCDAWNGTPSTIGLGGVVIFDASGNLNFNTSGGTPPLITASGLGGPGGTGGTGGSAATVSGGSNGAGGTAAGAGNGGDGGNASGGTHTQGTAFAKLGDDLYNCSSVEVHGGKGGVAVYNNGTEDLTDPSNFISSTYTTGGPYAIYIGNGGAGGDGGYGPSAGGWAGGGGGGYYAGTAGSDTPTVNSGYGGTGGNGANGGGIIYVRASTIDIATALAGTSVFASNGQNVDPFNGNGTSGYGNGGDGANGGNGGDGYFDNSTSTAVPAGGGGRGGPGGLGAGGGFGGIGGDAGPIWLIYCSAGSNNIAGTNWSAAGGTGGTGGAGTNTTGTSGTDGTNGNPPNLCIGNTCGATYGTVNYNQTFDCDCDDAMKILSDMNANSTSSYPYSYSNSGLLDESVTAYTGSFSAVETTYTSAGCTAPAYNYYNTYNCPMQTSSSFFTNIAGTLTFPGSHTITHTEWNSGADGFYENGTDNLYADNTSTPPPIASAVSACQYIGGGPDGQYGLNHNGANGHNGNSKFVVIDDDPQTPSSSVFSPNPVNSRAQDHAMSLYPNPAQDIVNVEFYTDSAERANIRVIDLTGKEYIKFNINSNSGDNNLSMGVGFLAPGSYVFCIVHDNRVEKSGFIKQ